MHGGHYYTGAAGRTAENPAARPIAGQPPPQRGREAAKLSSLNSSGAQTQERTMRKTIIFLPAALGGLVLAGAAAASGSGGAHSATSPAGAQGSADYGAQRLSNQSDSRAATAAQRTGGSGDAGAGADDATTPAAAPSGTDTSAAAKDPAAKSTSTAHKSTAEKSTTGQTQP
jgi:hypothetical protein